VIVQSPLDGGCLVMLTWPDCTTSGRSCAVVVSTAKVNVLS
jgi:hypothetical protein